MLTIRYCNIPGTKNNAFLLVKVRYGVVLSDIFSVIFVQAVEFCVWRKPHGTIDPACQQWLCKVVVGCVRLEITGTTNRSPSWHVQHTLSLLLTIRNALWSVVLVCSSTFNSNSTMSACDSEMIPGTLDLFTGPPLAFVLARFKTHWAYMGYVTEISKQPEAVRIKHER